MKKITLILFILLTFTSCANKEVGLDINKNTSNNIEVETNTGKTFSGSLNQEKQEKQSKNTYELKKHKDGNIYLYKNGKKIDYLTTKANSDDSCKKLEENPNYNKDEVEYRILNGSGKYGVVEKISHFCGGDSFIYDIYAIDFENIKEKNNLLIKILDNSNHLGQITYLKNDILLDSVNNKFVYERGTDGGGKFGFFVDELKKGGYKKENGFWEKEFNLDRIFSQKRNNQIKNGEYSDLELIKNGYKINTLGNINEYYKKENFDEDIWGKGIKFKTIYIKGKKILEIDNIYYSTLKGKYIPKISINNGKDSIYINNTIIPGYQFTDILPIQPIFKLNLGKSKLVIDKNLDKVNVIYNGKTFNIYSKGNLPNLRKKVEGISDISQKIEILKDEDDDEDGYVKAYIDTGKYGKYDIGNDNLGIDSNLGIIGKAYYNKKYNYMLISVIYDHVGSLMLTNTYKIDLNNKKIEKLKETLGEDFYFKSINEVVPVRQSMIDDGSGKISYFEEGKSIKIK